MRRLRTSQRITLLGVVFWVFSIPGWASEARWWRDVMDELPVTPALVSLILVVAGFLIILFANVPQLRFWERPPETLDDDMKRLIAKHGSGLTLQQLHELTGASLRFVKEGADILERRGEAKLEGGKLKPITGVIRSTAPAAQSSATVITGRSEPSREDLGEVRDEAEITPGQILSLFAGRTNLQVAKLTEKHKGEQLSATGTVVQVFPTAGAMTQAAIRLSSGKQVLAQFLGEENAQRLAGLSEGDPISVRGAFKKAEPSFVQLEDCEIVG